MVLRIGAWGVRAKMQYHAYGLAVWGGPVARMIINSVARARVKMFGAVLMKMEGRA